MMHPHRAAITRERSNVYRRIDYLNKKIDRCEGNSDDITRLVKLEGWAEALTWALELK